MLLLVESCEMPLPCTTQPCNQGTCTNSADGLTFSCVCMPGYEGDTCNTVISTCDESTCIHGNCVTIGDNTTCICLEGYKGKW